MAKDTPNMHILDTSAWNALFEDERRKDLVHILRKKGYPAHIGCRY
jgi:hypothetical protein